MCHILEEEGSIHSTICSETDEFSTILDDITSTTSEDREDNNSEQNINKDGKKTSEIWYHFDTTEQNQICKYCKKNYRIVLLTNKQRAEYSLFISY